MFESIQVIFFRILASWKHTFSQKDTHTLTHTDTQRETRVITIDKICKADLVICLQITISALISVPFKVWSIKKLRIPIYNTGTFLTFYSPYARHPNPPKMLRPPTKPIDRLIDRPSDLLNNKPINLRSTTHGNNLFNRAISNKK